MTVEAGTKPTPAGEGVAPANAGALQTDADMANNLSVSRVNVEDK